MRTLSNDPRFDEMAQQIAWAVDSHEGFDLFFVVANTSAGREAFSKALVRALPNTSVIDLQEERRRFLSVLRDDAAEARTVLVTGLDSHASKADERGSLFGGLNIDRDAIRALERNLVILLPSFALTALAQSAPDFYDFRTVTLEVPEEASGENPTPFQNRSPILANTPEDRARWIGILKAQSAGSDSEAELERQIHLAYLLDERGDFLEAEMILRSLVLQTDETHPMRSTIMNNFGTVLQARGDLDGAMAAYREAERIDRAAYGDDHPEVAIRVNNIGSVLRDRGDLDGAMAAYREAERIDRAAYGHDHPKVATRINNVGGVLQARGDLDGAMAAYREAERIDRAAYGDDHPIVAVDVNNFASVLHARGDLDGAMAAYQKALRISRAAYGDDHPEVAIRVNNIGSVLRDRGDLDGAMAAYREAERIDRAAYGDDHPKVATRINNVGGVLQARGDLDGAMAAYQKALIILVKVFGVRGTNVAPAAHNLASLGGDPVALIRERLGEDAARELAVILEDPDAGL